MGVGRGGRRRGAGLGDAGPLVSLVHVTFYVAQTHVLAVRPETPAITVHHGDYMRHMFSRAVEIDINSCHKQKKRQRL
jgi:hypothetical protein